MLPARVIQLRIAHRLLQLGGGSGGGGGGGGDKQQ